MIGKNRLLREMDEVQMWVPKSPAGNCVLRFLSVIVAPTGSRVSSLVSLRMVA